MLRVLLDGMLIPESDHTDFNTASITMRQKNEEDEIAYSFTSDLTFFNDTAIMIKSRLIDDPNGINRRFEVDIYDECCEYVIFRGEMNPDTLDWCEGDCRVTGTIVERKIKTRQHSCVETTFIWDKSTRFHEAPHDFVKHCVLLRPEMTHYLFILTTTFSLALIIIALPALVDMIMLVTAINIIMQILTLGTWKPIPEIKEFDIAWVVRLVDDTRRNIVGCGRGHPAPTVRSYIQNVCYVCGLNFRSSILNDEIANPDYYDMMVHYAPVTFGEYDYYNFSDDDKPILTGHQMLRKLEKVFNAEYRIINNDLVFERKDFFPPGPLWFSVTDIRQLYPRVESLCYEYTTDRQPYYGHYKYSDDPIEMIGSEAKWHYDDIVDYTGGNPAAYPRLKGKKEVTFEFARMRGRHDDPDGDPLTKLVEMLILVVFICTAVSAVLTVLAIFFPALIPYAVLAWSYTAAIILVLEYANSSEHDNVLYMSGNVCSEMKLLCRHEGDNSIRQNAKTKYEQRPNGTYRYNRPLWVAAGGDSTESQKEYVPNNLWDRFLFLDNPTKRYRKQLRYKLVITRDCDLLKKFDFDMHIDLPMGSGTIEEVTISETSIHITGLV